MSFKRISYLRFRKLTCLGKGSEGYALNERAREAEQVTDVLIVGGGVAGSSLAIMLGRKGLAVNVFEKARFPREKLCGEGLMPQGVAVLQRLGLTAAVGGCPFYGVRFHFQAQTREVGAPKVIRFRSPGLGQRRRVLDQVLLSAAEATSECLS